MFILAPTLLILGSLVGVAVIIFRKRNYLNKLYLLNTAGNGNGISQNFSWEDLLNDFFPELKVLIEKIDLGKHKSRWLIGLEKFLRKMRVVSLKMDRISDVMIKKIRRIHTNEKLNGTSSKTDEAKITENIIADALPKNETSPAIESMSLNFLKNEEKRLIMEIAKNPKDSKLYESLGDIYAEMNSLTDAKESYEAAIELSPQNESLKYKLSLALEKLASGQS